MFYVKVLHSFLHRFSTLEYFEFYHASSVFLWDFGIKVVKWCRNASRHI